MRRTSTIRLSLKKKEEMISKNEKRKPVCIAIIIWICFVLILRSFLIYFQPQRLLIRKNNQNDDNDYKEDHRRVDGWKYKPLYRPENFAGFGEYSKKLGDRRCERFDQTAHCSNPEIMKDMVHVMHVSWRIPVFLPYHLMLYVNTSVIPMGERNGRSLAPQFIYLLESALNATDANHFVFYEDDVKIKDYDRLADQACVAAESAHPFASFSPSSSTCEFLFGIYAFYIHRSFAITLLENMKIFYENPEQQLLVDFYLASTYNLTSLKSNLADHIGKSLRTRRIRKLRNYERILKRDYQRMEEDLFIRKNKIVY